MGSRRLSGYKLEYLQSISLAGLQTLARTHGLEDEAETVPEMIELLARDEEEYGEEGDDACDDSEGFFVRSPQRCRPPAVAESNVSADSFEQESEDKEEEDDTTDDKAADKEEQHSAATDVDEAEATPVDVADELAAAFMSSAPPALPLPPAIVVPSGSAKRALPRSEASGKIKAWQRPKGFLPKASKSTAVVAVVAPIGGGASGGIASAQKALDAAKSKKAEEEKRQAAALARREAAQARRERILGAFKKTQANIQIAASEQPLKVVSSKAPAAWELAAARAIKEQSVKGKTKAKAAAAAV